MYNSESKSTIKLPEPSLRRLPWYLAYIKLLQTKGEEYVSSTQIAKEIGVDSSKIAKDLSFINISGKTRVGYEINSLVAVLEEFLGFTSMHKAFIFGVGSLCRAHARFGIVAIRSRSRCRVRCQTRVGRNLH